MASSLYCLLRTLGYWVFLVSSRKPLTERREPETPSEPKATMEAEAGAADHWARLISACEPGWACGAMDFETMSKMPALARSS